MLMRAPTRFVFSSLIVGTSFVHAPRPLPGQTTQPPLWTLTREARFGGTGDSLSDLIQPQVAVIAPDGNSLVFDYRTREIKVYDPAGKYLRRVGRGGQGPGEYRRVGTMGYLGDTLWITDPELRRITLFPPRSGEPKTFPLRYEPTATGTLMGTMPQGMLRGGLVVAQGVLSPGRPASTPAVESPVVLMRRNGTFADTAAMPTIHASRDISFRVIDRQGRQVTWGGGQPFRSEHFLGARTDGRGFVLVSPAATARSGAAAFQVQTFDSLGRETRSRSYSYEPVRVSDRIRDSVINGIGIRSGVDSTAAVRRQIELADLVPTVTNLRVGSDGSVWLRRERLVNDGLLWTVIDPSGALVARVMMPVGAIVAYADMDRVLTFEDDADGVQWVVRYRVARAGR
jgi:hypothetical protein